MASSLTQVTEQNFEQEVLRSDLPVLLEFGAEWCGPCKVVAPELEALSRELSGKAKIVTVDIDRSPVLAQEFGVRSVPTFVVMHQGQPVDGKVGALRKPQLQAMLEAVLPKAAGALKPVELAQLIQARRVTPVDTREPAVFARTRLPGAVNIPAGELSGRLAELAALPAPPVLYCRTGEQTKDLAASFAEEGVPVSFLEGGVLNWEAEGFEVERPD